MWSPQNINALGYVRKIEHHVMGCSSFRYTPKHTPHKRVNIIKIEVCGRNKESLRWGPLQVFLLPLCINTTQSWPLCIQSVTKLLQLSAGGLQIGLHMTFPVFANIYSVVVVVLFHIVHHYRSKCMPHVWSQCVICAHTHIQIFPPPSLQKTIRFSLLPDL